ncbi:histidine kinase [Streptosporangium sp. NPDC000396]|uniref:sensor histidine kinase n=1 Tax=Streptosporangium sp. NPDC000396 TaxID=3366185 RepID=UPI0036A44A50
MTERSEGTDEHGTRVVAEPAWRAGAGGPATPQLRLAWLLILICLAVQLPIKIDQLIQAAIVSDRVALVPGLLILIALQALFIPIAFRRVSRPTAHRLLLAQAVLAYSFYLVQSPWTPVMATLAASILLTCRPRTAWSLVLLVLVGEFTIRAWFFPEIGSIVPWSVLATLGPGVGFYAVCWLYALIRQTDSARAEIARLEAARERLRVARDLCDTLHDKLSALIHRFDHADLAEVVRTARQALTDVRAVADDHRDRTLAAELEAARSVLTAAGVDAEITTRRHRLPTPVDDLLARVVRKTVLTWLSTDPPHHPRVDVDLEPGFVRLRATRAQGQAPGLGEFTGEIAELGGDLTTGTGWVEVALPVTPAPAPPRPIWGPLAGAPWLAWLTLVVLEVDTMGTTVINMIWSDPVTTTQIVVAAVALPVVSALQLYNGLPRRGARPRAWRWTLSAQILLLFAAMAVIGPNAGSYTGLTAGTALFLVRSRLAWVIAAAPIICGTAFWVPNASGVLSVIEYTMVMIGFAAMAYALSRLPVAAFQLEDAHRELARMAALQERLRVARDLHDLLGFRLSALVVKGELLIADPGRTPDELADLREVARQALVDVRSITGDPTPLSLPEEAATARSMLAAAGVEVTLDPLPVRLPSEIDTLLAVVLREAVTNVVRHARARGCTISVTTGCGAVRLTIANDGATGSPEREGNGLTNLTRRLEEAGGHLAVRREADWFTLAAEVPCSEPAGLGGDADGVHPVARVQLGDR